MRHSGRRSASVHMNRTHTAVTFLAAVALLCAWPVASQATPDASLRASGKCDTFVRSVLNRNSTRGWSSVLLWIDGSLTPAQRGQLCALHADIYRNLPAFSTVAARVPSRQLMSLAGLAFVKRVSADVDVRKHDEYTVGASGADTAFAQQGLTGDGLTVAVVDSGVCSTTDLSDTRKGSRVVASVGFVPGDMKTDDACGHGTHVAGIVAGNGNASTGTHFTRTFYGIARQTHIANVRVLDGKGLGKVSTVLSGIAWVIANRSKYNIRVMNLSFGHPVGESFTTDPLCRAVEQAWISGIVVVCAAGNNGRTQDTPNAALDNEGFGTNYGSITSPGNDPLVITVGAMKRVDGVRSNDRIATYSSRGPSRLDFVVKPDLVAPGNRVISINSYKSYLDGAYASTNEVTKAEYTNCSSDQQSHDYFRLSGTSMAAPVVAGAAALMLQANPTLTPDTVKARLMMSADKLATPDGLCDPCTFGAGYLNIPAALACTYLATERSLSPMLVCDGLGNIALVAYGDVNGTRAIWGRFDVSALRAIWGPAFCPSSSVLNASRAIWGKAVWFDSSVWSTADSAADLSVKTIYGE